MTCVQPPPPGLPREDTGAQDLSLLRASDPGPQHLVGTGLRVESRPVSLIRRVKAPLGWSLPHGRFPWTTCLPPSPRDGSAGQSPRRVLACSALPTRSVIVTKVAPPPTPQACGQGPWDGARREGTRGAETHGRDVAAPHRPSGPSGLRCPVSCWRPCPGCGREGKGPGVAVQPCRLPVSWPYRFSHRVEVPLARPLLLAAGTCEVSSTPFPPELEATCSGREDRVETTVCLPHRRGARPGTKASGSGSAGSPSMKPTLRAGGGRWGAG